MTIRHILTIAATTSIAACALTSCDWIKDDLSDCPECQGTLSVKIEHRYNMLHADAAPSRVEKADVFIRNTVTGETQHKAFDKAMLDASGYYADMEFAGAGTSTASYGQVSTTRSSTGIRRPSPSPHSQATPSHTVCHLSSTEGPMPPTWN